MRISAVAGVACGFLRECVLGTCVLAAGLLAAPLRAQPEQTQTPALQSELANRWPERAIRIVVGFPPGPLDVIGRPIAAKLQQALGVNVLFENRPGANGAIATEQVARGESDGYTLLMGTAGTHETAVHLVKNLRYDPVKDFEPVIALTEPATCLVSYPGLPVRSVTELITYAKANPGKLSYGSPGIGSVFHLVGELFNQKAGVEIVHVPYKGADSALNDLIGNQIPLLYSSVSTVGAQVDSGRVRMLAILEPQRFSKLPDLPSISETLPSFQKPATWFGFFVKRGTPLPLVRRINAEVAKIIEAPDFRAMVEQNGSSVISGPPEKLRDLMVDGIARFGEMVKAAGIEPE